MPDIGIHFPQAEIPSDFAVIRDFAQAAEAQGFSHINVPDHVLQTRTPRADFPAAARYTTEFPHHEAIVILAYLAGVTSRMLLKTAVLILPQRQAVLVAKQAAELDIVSGGRMQLGVGLGWNHPEYEALDMDFHNRGKRMVEQIEVCRLLWTEKHPSFEGKWHRFHDAGLAAMPVQQPIPIWIGAFAPPAIARAAQIGDGWQAMLPAPDAEAARTFAAFRDAVRDAGRDPQRVGIEATILATGDDPEAWVAEARSWLEVGATQIMFRPRGDFDYIQRAVASFAPLMKDV
jgi:probable F420-dependent oxidoreductase